MPINITDLLQGGELNEFNELPPEHQAECRAEFDSAVNSQLKPIGVLLGVVERLLDLAHASDILPKIAALQRRYFVSLMDQGFTAEQAMALSSNFGSALAGLKKG